MNATKTENTGANSHMAPTRRTAMSNRNSGYSAENGVGKNVKPSAPHDKPLVAATYTLAEIVEAQEAFLTKQHVGKIVLVD